MLFRISILSFIVMYFSAFALTDEEKRYIESNKSAIENVEKNFKELKEKRKKLDKEKLMPRKEDLMKAERFKGLTENKSDVSKYENLGKNFNLEFLENIYGNNWLDFELNLKQKKKKKKNLIFYLFSTSIPKETVKNVFLASKKYDDLEFYGVLRGINKKTARYLNKLDNAMNNMVVKVNPLIFKKVDAKVVPAFVIAECPEIYGIIRTKYCKFKAILYGDVSLDFAIEKFKEAGYWNEKKEKVGKSDGSKTD